MTATPIPRTLALTIYGDLDLSVIDTMPAGRKKIITELVFDKDREKTYEKIILNIMPVLLPIRGRVKMLRVSTYQ